MVKLGATGELEYARVLDGVSAQGLAIAVSSAGEALVSGTVTLKDDQAAAGFPTTPGAVTLRSVFNSGFLTKLDPSGKNIVVSILGYGGGPVGFDAAGNLYVTGQLQFANLTPTPGALQTQHDTFGCTGTSYVGSSCIYEYVAKISPDGTKLLYATYLTGQWGSVPTALFVDSAGNAIVAGTTPSHDFPVTPGAFQSENHGTDGPSVLYGFTGAHLPNIPPPTPGVISKVNPNGTALLWSTYFGGSGVETITGAQLDSAGNIVFTGLTGSPDLPGSAPLPRGCAPSYLRQRPYVAKLSADGTSVLSASYLDSLQGAPELAIAFSSFLPVAQPQACIVDSADLAMADRVAPNQLLTIFTSLGAAKPQVYFNGVAGEILYSGTDQINVRVPANLTGSSVAVAVDTPAGLVSRTLSLVTAAPSAFVAFTTLPADCGASSYPFAFVAVARNSDGTMNSCAQPAVSGSVVTFFLNGVGGVNPSVSIQKSSGSATILSVDSDPASPGIVRVQVRFSIPPVGFSPAPYEMNYSLTVNGQSVRDGLLFYVLPLIG